MNEQNKFLTQIDDEIKKKLPLTYRFTQSMTTLKNELTRVDAPASVEINFYESKSIEQNGFHRPISKMIILEKNERK